VLLCWLSANEVGSFRRHLGTQAPRSLTQGWRRLPPRRQPASPARTCARNACNAAWLCPATSCCRCCAACCSRHCATSRSAPGSPGGACWARSMLVVGAAHAVVAALPALLAALGRLAAPAASASEQARSHAHELRVRRGPGRCMRRHPCTQHQPLPPAPPRQPASPPGPASARVLVSRASSSWGVRSSAWCAMTCASRGQEVVDWICARSVTLTCTPVKRAGARWAGAKHQSSPSALHCGCAAPQLPCLPAG
jgi:hypothetical protein